METGFPETGDPRTDAFKQTLILGFDQYTESTRYLKP